MSTQVEPVVEAAELEDLVTTVEQPPLVVDKQLVARLVGDAQRQGLPVDGEDGLARAADEAGRRVRVGGRADRPFGLRQACPDRGRRELSQRDTVEDGVDEGGAGSDRRAP